MGHVILISKSKCDTGLALNIHSGDSRSDLCLTKLGFLSFLCVAHSTPSQRRKPFNGLSFCGSLSSSFICVRLRPYYLALHGFVNLSP